jgi:hypothetical protein
MQLEELVERLKKIETIVESKGLEPDVKGYVNWFGDDLDIAVRASEPFDANGYWSSERSFKGSSSEAEDLLRQAHNWTYTLPGEEDRAVEVMIKKLTEVMSKLPTGNTDITRAAWEGIREMLRSKVKRLAENSLPSPDRIREV